MKKILRKLIVGLFMINITTIASASIINLEGDTSAVTLFFQAGTYSVNPIGVAEGGLYNAHNIWNGNVSLPAVGWMHRYAINSLELGEIIKWDLIKYASDIEALNNASNTNFTLSTDSSVSFYTLDGGTPIDNVGGISLNVNSVPIPGAVWLFGTGLIWFIGMRKNPQ